MCPVPRHPSSVIRMPHMLPTSTIGETGAKKDWAVVGWGRLKGVKRLGGGKEDGGDRSGGVGGGGGHTLKRKRKDEVEVDYISTPE